MYAGEELQASQSSLLKVTSLLHRHTAASKYIYKSRFLAGMFSPENVTEDKQQLNLFFLLSMNASTDISHLSFLRKCD